MYTTEAQSVSEYLTAAKIMALILGILDLIGFLAAIVLALLGFGFGWFGAFLLVGFVVNTGLFIETGVIQDHLSAGQVQAAKDRSLVWVILGFVFGWLIVGILLLVAYLRFDLVINQQRGVVGFSPHTYASGFGPPAYAGVPMQPLPSTPSAVPQPAPPPPLAAAAVPMLPLCPRCGRPAIWIPPYNRWFCYTEFVSCVIS
jgi:hypothetical protein